MNKRLIAAGLALVALGFYFAVVVTFAEGFPMPETFWAVFLLFFGFLIAYYGVHDEKRQEKESG